MNPKNVADMYALSASQAGMLFHHRLAPDAKEYFIQWIGSFEGNINANVLQQAFQTLVERHTALRSIFLWEGLDHPLQVVRQTATIEWHELDWREHTDSEQQLQAWLYSDQQRGFDLKRAPLMRATLIQSEAKRYTLIISVHHIIIDGWSLGLALEEVFAIYHALSEQQQLELPKPRPFRDYIAWQQQQHKHKAQQFWRTMLQGFQQPNRISIDTPQNVGLTSQSQHYRDYYHTLTLEQSAQLNQFARSNRITLSTLFHAAWALLLSRYSDSNDIVFGTVVSGRPADLEQSEQMIGMFINTIPIRLNTSADQSLLPWLQQVQSTLIEARQYEHTPLVDIQTWSEVEAGQALFENLLNIESYPNQASFEGPELSFCGSSIIEHTNYPLNLSITPGQKIGLKVIYNQQRFTADSIEQLLQRLQNLIFAMAQQTQATLGQISMLDQAEQQQLLLDWNATVSPHQRNQTLHKQIEYWAHHSPNTNAAVWVQSDGQEQSISFQELDQRANQIAHRLQQLGVGPESLVGLSLERSLDIVIGILGILKAGGAFVPIDPNYPSERISYMLQDAQINTLITQAPLLDKLPWQDAQLTSEHIICLDRDSNQLNAYSKYPIEDRATLDTLAYMIYTSGSTGKPKGVLVEHRGIGNLAESFIRAFGIQASDHVLQVSSLSFDAALCEIAMTLSAGATLYFAPPDMLMAGAALSQLLQSQQINHMIITPLALAATPYQQLPALRSIAVAGEACPIELAKQWSQGRNFINAYGPTELTVCASMHHYQGASSVPIGKPIINTAIYLLDHNLQPVPIGMAGEMYLGGIGLTRGYHQRPELTAERFIDNPHYAYIEQHGNPAIHTMPRKLYRTGDLARYQADGSIEFLGRVDHQVKLRGFRIELSEIEHTLKQYPMVKDAVLTMPNNQSLIAYITSDETLDPHELKQYLRQSLPEFMIPNHIISLHEFPLLPNGKLNRAGLPSPQSSAPSQAPSTPIEQKIAHLWAEALQVEHISPHDNFFDLGGHSLMLAQLHPKLEQLSERPVALVDLFKFPTIQSLAGYLDNSQQNEPVMAQRSEQWKAGRDRLAQRRNQRRG